MDIRILHYFLIVAREGMVFYASPTAVIFLLSPRNLSLLIDTTHISDCP